MADDPFEDNLRRLLTAAHGPETQPAPEVRRQLFEALRQNLPSPTQRDHHRESFPGMLLFGLALLPVVTLFTASVMLLISNVSGNNPTFWILVGVAGLNLGLSIPASILIIYRRNHDKKQIA